MRWRGRWEASPRHGWKARTWRYSVARTYSSAAIIAVHAWQQVIWYQKLQPDTQSFATIECLKRNGIRGGYAEYWTAYKLTFLSHEEIIVAPTDGVDRYPATRNTCDRFRRTSEWRT